MADIQLSIMIPIKAEDLKDLSVEKIVAALENSGSQGKVIQELESKLKWTFTTIQMYARSMQLILDEVSDPMDRAVALRDLSAEMRKFSGAA